MSNDKSKPNPEETADPQEGTESQAPVRICPSCSAQSQTRSDTCPHCGASFIRSRSMRMKKRVKGMSQRRKIVIAGVTLGLLIGGIAVGVALKVEHDNKIAQENKEADEARELAQEEAAEEAEEIREEEETEEELERIEAKYGQESVVELQEAITKDANSEAEEGFSEYVSETICEAEGGEVDTTLAAQNFDCMAVTTEEGSIQEGYRYTGTINYAKGSFSWRLGGP